jgi:multiple sugar transport system permease protein
MHYALFRGYAMSSIRNRHIRWKNMCWALLFAGPTVFGLYLFFIYPMFKSVYISLTKWDGLSSPQFIGIANYVQLLSDPTVGKELFNTAFFIVLLVPITVVLALLLASAFDKRLPGTGFFRTVFFLPYVMLPVVTAQIGMTMFNSKFGIINQWLAWLGVPAVQWLTDPWLVRSVIVLMNLWAGIGYYAIILLAGLQNIPRQYYEACELDGASAWRKLTNVTVPLLTPQLFFSVVMATIGAFKMFDFIFVFGKSNLYARESLRTMAYGIYERGFTFLDIGFASAEAVVLGAFMLIITIAQNMSQERWVYYS